MQIYIAKLLMSMQFIKRYADKKDIVITVLPGLETSGQNVSEIMYGIIRLTDRCPPIIHI